MSNIIDIECHLDHFSASEGSMIIYDKLVKKFEINKKVYSRYETGYKTNSSFKELTTTQYKKLISCLLLVSIIAKDIRYYNTALKIGAKIKFKLPTIDILSVYGKN